MYALITPHARTPHAGTRHAARGTRHAARGMRCHAQPLSLGDIIGEPSIYICVTIIFMNINIE